MDSDEVRTISNNFRLYRDNLSLYFFQQWLFFKGLFFFKGCRRKRKHQEDETSGKRARRNESKAEIKEKLRKSILTPEERSPNYEELKGESPELCETPEQCRKLFKLYEKGIKRSQYNVLFYTAQQGHLLTILKKLVGKNYQTVINDQLHISMGLARLRVRVFNLVNEYQRLMNSSLSLNFFNQNLSVIREICEESGDEFK